MSEKGRLLEEARTLGMSLAPLRSLPISEIRKRIHAFKSKGRKGGQLQ